MATVLRFGGLPGATDGSCGALVRCSFLTPTPPEPKREHGFLETFEGIRGTISRDLIGSEPLVLRGFALGYRFYIGKPVMLPAPSPQPPSPSMFTFGLGPCLCLGLEALSSWPSLAQSNQH